MKKSRTSFKRESLLLISYSQETTQLSFFQTIITIVRKELIALEKEGLFSSSRQGNLLYYSLNKEYPLYNEIKTIVFKTVGIQGALSQVLMDIKGIEAAFIYGSYAKNTSHAKSDIDLFILGNPNMEYSGQAFL